MLGGEEESEEVPAAVAVGVGHGLVRPGFEKEPQQRNVAELCGLLQGTQRPRVAAVSPVLRVFRAGLRAVQGRPPPEGRREAEHRGRDDEESVMTSWWI